MSDETDRRYEELLPYYDRVVAFLRQLGFDHEDARDLAQEVFIRVYEHRADYRADAKWNYLQQVTRRLAYNAIRDRHAGKRHGIAVSEEVLLERGDEQTPRPDAVLETKATARRLRAAVDRLEPNQRVCVVLFYLEELSYREICLILDVSLPALKSRLNAARTRLRELLGEEPEGWPDEPDGSGDDS